MKTLYAKILTMILGVFLVSSLFTAPAQAAVDPSNPGSWTAPVNCPGFNPIHAAMLPSGKILAMAGSGYNRPNHEAIKDGTMTVEQAWIYNPATPNVCPQDIPLPSGVDLFCAGMTHLPDGRILVFGGTGKYGEPTSKLGLSNYYGGIKDTYVYDEADNAFTKLDDMSVARWYGTGLIRADGSVVVFGGLNENAGWTQNHQLFNPATMKWTNLPTPPWKMPMYAGSFLLQNGLAAYTGTYFGSRNGVMPMMWNPITNASTPIPGLQFPDCRDQANTLVVYPKVYVIGGGCSTGTTSSVNLLDVSKQPLQFTNAGYSNLSGMHQCGAVLPDKSLFISGGTNHNLSPTLGAKRLGPTGTTWQTLASPTVKRGYHSTCLTLKDGRVLTMGTNWNDGLVETRIEIYNPWYTQAGFTRPTMTMQATTTKNSCGQIAPKAGTKVTAKIGVATVVNATLTKIPSVTHQHDPNNRLVTLPLTTNADGTVSFTMPAANPVTPKGMYMLSMLDWRGAPTLSQMVSVGDTGSAGCCC